MKEINQKEYEALLDRGLRGLGKIMPYDLMTPEIYFIISPEEMDMGACGVVEEISKNHTGFIGQFDVTCNWTPIQTVTIVYPTQDSNK